LNENRKFSKERNKKIGLYRLGKKSSDETKEKIRQKLLGNNNGKGNYGKKGELAPNWRGGTTKMSEIIRGSTEYKLWRESVMKRDKWTCIWCGYRSKGSGDIHADHIKPFSLYPELRFAIDNGRTLCVGCHKTTDSFLNNKITKIVYQIDI
jgi:5-methylcytosine-specific restriction endonuclease McrA